MPCGWLNWAVVKSPSLRPATPEPITSRSVPSSLATTMRLWLLSEMNSRPEASSARILPGNRNGVAAAAWRSMSNRSGVSSKQLLLPIIGHARADHLIDLLEGNLAAGAPDGIAFRIDQDHRRPGLHAERAPTARGGRR